MRRFWQHSHQVPTIRAEHPHLILPHRPTNSPSARIPRAPPTTPTNRSTCPQGPWSSAASASRARISAAPSPTHAPASHAKSPSVTHGRRRHVRGTAKEGCIRISPRITHTLLHTPNTHIHAYIKAFTRLSRAALDLLGSMPGVLTATYYSGGSSSSAAASAPPAASARPMAPISTAVLPLTPLKVGRAHACTFASGGRR